MPNPLANEAAQKAATQNGWQPTPQIEAAIIGAAVVAAGWWISVYVRNHSDAGRRRAQFRSYMDTAIRAITVENANNLAIRSSFQACIDYNEFDQKRKDVRPDILRKGVFDAACEACKKVGFIAYNDVQRNAAQKAELLRRLAKVRSLAC